MKYLGIFLSNFPYINERIPLYGFEFSLLNDEDRNFGDKLVFFLDEGSYL